MSEETHIRAVADPHARLCGAETGESVSFEHYRERLTAPAIRGQLVRLPKMLCWLCQKKTIDRLVGHMGGVRA